MTQALNVLALFDGISCGQLALKQCQIPVKAYYASEIDKYAIEITKKNFPDTIHVGDVTKIQSSTLPKIDLLIGGSPCQNLSSLFDKKGLAGTKSSLFYEYVRLKNELNPKWFLFENVASMSNKNRDEITQALGVEPIMIDSALFVPQRRKRYYWTNIPIENLPEKETQLKVQDLLLTNVSKQEFISTKAHNWIFNKKTAWRARVQIDRETANPITTAYHSNGQNENYYLDNLNFKKLFLTYKQFNYAMLKTPFNNCPKIDKDTASPIKTMCYTGNATADNYYTDIDVIQYEGITSIRKLHPIEYERLQGLPDNYTDSISNTQRYRTIGNGWTIPVISHILKQIK